MAAVFSLPSVSCTLLRTDRSCGDAATFEARTPHHWHRRNHQADRCCPESLSEVSKHWQNCREIGKLVGEALWRWNWGGDIVVDVTVGGICQRRRRCGEFSSICQLRRLVVSIKRFFL
ncbi:hypothetical protein WJX77_011708 [Trebouxia sp. C0004]